MTSSCNIMKIKADCEIQYNFKSTKHAKSPNKDGQKLKINNDTVPVSEKLSLVAKSSHQGCQF